MKKIISTIFLVVLTGILVMPVISLAQGAPKTVPDSCRLGHSLEISCPVEDDGVTCIIPSDGSNNCGMCCLLNTIYTVTDWVFYLMLIAVVLAGVIGGALYMTAAGDAEKAGKGKKIIIYAIIGLALALIARLIPSVVKMILGMG